MNTPRHDPNDPEFVKSVDAEIQRQIRLKMPRPDADDLTPLIVRLPKEKFIATSAWMAATGKKPKLPLMQQLSNLWFWSFIVAVAAIVIVLGLKQLL